MFFIKRGKKFLLVCLFVIMALLSGCGNGTKVVFTTGFGKDEIFRIGDASCTKAELLVYLTTTGNRYESVYGPSVWNAESDGVSLADNVKETVLAKLAQVKTMYLLAQSQEITLEPEEVACVEQAAAAYLGSLTEAEREKLSVDEELMIRMYTEYALADKVYRYIIRDVNPEISDDEARTITVEHILFRTRTVDMDGKSVPYSDAVKKAVYEKACEVRTMAVEEGVDFLSLAAKYSEDSNTTYSFGKGEMESSFEEAAFRLETDEISEVIETEAGYHIIKCISTFDREQTEVSKLEIVEQRRQEVFGQVYNEFVEDLPRQLNTKLWEDLSLSPDSDVKGADFFRVYSEYFTV